MTGLFTGDCVSCIIGNLDAPASILVFILIAMGICVAVLVYIRLSLDNPSVVYFGIKDKCCTNENIQNLGNMAQCQTCKRIFEVKKQ